MRSKERSCRRELHIKGETLVTSLPDFAAASMLLISVCELLTASMAWSITLESLSRRPATTSSSTEEIIASTLEISLRPLVNGEFGNSAMVAIPMTQPISASIARSSPPLETSGGKIVAIRMEPMTIWLLTSTDFVSREPTISAMNTMSVICKGPVMPVEWKSRSPTATPSTPPIAISKARLSRSPPDRPRIITTDIGAKNGCGWPTNSWATQ